MTEIAPELQRRIAAVEQRVTAVEEDLKQNTATTNSIKADTEQLVLMLRASKLGAEIVKWCATVGGGTIVAYAAIRGLIRH